MKYDIKTRNDARSMKQGGGQMSVLALLQNE